MTIWFFACIILHTYCDFVQNSMPLTNQHEWTFKNIKSQTGISLLFYSCHRIGIFMLPTRPTFFDKHHAYNTSVIQRQNEFLMYIPTWWRIYQHGVIPRTYLILKILNAYCAILNAYFAILNAYFEILNAYFAILNAYFTILNTYFYAA